MHTITKEELENVKYNTGGYLDEILRLLGKDNIRKRIYLFNEYLDKKL